MRLAFLLFVLLHGAIHIFGFLKGLGLKDFKELTLPVSRPMAFLWLATAVLFVAYGVLHFTNSTYAWVAGLLAVISSQILIIVYWQDARFGTIANAVIAGVVAASIGHHYFQKQVVKETVHLLEQTQTEERTVVEEDLHSLPIPVKNWIRHSGMIGKPFIRVARVTQNVRMQMKPGDTWMSAKAIQYTTTYPPAFIWTVDVKMNSLLNFQGRDKFENGKGEMLIKLNSLINVVNAQGEKLDEAALQRYLGEIVWFPSSALSPYVSWEHINDSTAKATITYKGTTGSGTFHFNAQGDVAGFSAMRYKDNDPAAKKHEWIIDILDYKTFEGIRVPAKMTSTWKLDEGDWTWLELEVMDIRHIANAGKN